MNFNFANISEWFLDKKLNIRFGEDKTKCIIFGRRRKLKKVV